MAVHSCFGRSVLWSKCALVAVCFGRRVHSRCSAPEALSQLPDERRQADTQSACSLYIGTRRWPPIDHTAHAVAAHHRPRGGGRLRRCRQARAGPDAEPAGGRHLPAATRSGTPAQPIYCLYRKSPFVCSNTHAAGLPEGPSPAGIPRADDGATAVDLLVGEPASLATGPRATRVATASLLVPSRFHHCPTGRLSPTHSQPPQALAMPHPIGTPGAGFMYMKPEGTCASWPALAAQLRPRSSVGQTRADASPHSSDPQRRGL